MINNESDYQEILQQAVALIEATRNKVARTVILSLNELHWEIGKLLYEKKLASKHGDAVVKRLSVDLKMKYPDMGMSVRNLYQMKRFKTPFNKNGSAHKALKVKLKNFQYIFILYLYFVYFCV